MDVTAFDEHETIVADVLGKVGPIDVMVLNSGISLRGTGLETSLTVLQRIMDVNFLGAVSPARIVARGMVERGSGHLVVVSSVVGYVSTPGRTAYAASKHALHGWFNGFRAELHGTGVGVTIATPGYVRTDISRNSLTADGSVHGVMDAHQANGMDPDRCAAKIVRAVQRKKAEVAMGGPERFAIPLVRFFPGLVRRVISGHKPY
jgi:short-subunit dehydrogenase